MINDSNREVSNYFFNNYVVNRRQIYNIEKENIILKRVKWINEEMYALWLRTYNLETKD